ncbi:MAG: nucleoside deaminase [Oscillospiraceae bacterium]
MKASHEQFMLLALKEAKKAQEKNEVPIGCVIVKDEKVVSAAHNARECKNNSLAHAEILAINKACENLGSWRLCGCTLYVTLEPCPMCMGAIINSRIDTVCFGTSDEKAGCCGSVADFNEFHFNHKPLIIRNVCKKECAGLLSDFFLALRLKKQEKIKATSQNDNL